MELRENLSTYLLHHSALTTSLDSTMLSMVDTRPSSPKAPSESNDTSASLTCANDELGLYDVICGRHKAAFNNVGNWRFRVTVSMALERYISAPTRKEKSNVINSIADLVRSNGGCFLQRQDGAWVELNEQLSYQKVGHALRDMVVATSSRNVTSTAVAARNSAFLPMENMVRQVSSDNTPLPAEHITVAVFEDSFATEMESDVESSSDPCDSYMMAWLIDQGERILDPAVALLH